ncbi:DUF58 domain-containing protein [soil metagenome]
MSTSTLKELPYMELLPQETSGTVAKLELLARAKTLGTISGRHVSPNKGFSVEFAEHRQYVPGDDLRNLDWRVFGKADRYYIKQYIEETNLRATIILDASGSMRYTGESASKLGGKRVSKFEYARYLAAALAYLMIRQQDAVGLVTFDKEVRTHIRSASRPSQVRRILEELHGTEAGDDTALSETLHEIAEIVPSRGLVIVLSDLFDDPDALVKALHHFAFRGHELILFHVMAEEELTFPFDRFQEFIDLEPGAVGRTKVDPRTIRAAYLERVRSFVSQLERACGQLKADYVPVNTKKPYEKALSDYLTARRSRV